MKEILFALHSFPLIQPSEHRSDMFITTNKERGGGGGADSLSWWYTPLAMRNYIHMLVHVPSIDSEVIEVFTQAKSNCEM